MSEAMLIVATVNVVAALFNLWNAVRNHRTAKANLRNAEALGAHIRWALMALHLVRNKLTALGIAENDTAMENLAAAEKTLRSIDGVGPSSETQQEKP